MQFKLSIDTFSLNQLRLKSKLWPRRIFLIPVINIQVSSPRNSSQNPSESISNVNEIKSILIPPDSDKFFTLQEHGAAYEAGGLEVGQLILEVDSNKVEKMQHQVSLCTVAVNEFLKFHLVFHFVSPKKDVARLIAECYANRDRNEITFLVVEAKKSNLEPKPTALVFLEQ
jgi:hypothetical protein